MSPAPGAPWLDALEAELRAALEASAPIEDAFIRRVLKAQRTHLPGVGPFLDAIGAPEEGPWWAQAVPSDLFRHRSPFPEAALGPPARIFRSSGTTSGSHPSRAPYSKQGLALMDAVIDLGARLSLFPDGARTRILVLAPPPDLAPQMIMAYGMDRLIQRFGLPGSRFLIGPGGLPPDALPDALSAARAEGCPVTLIGASFAFVHITDALVAQGGSLPLLEGSRVMHAGGFKGRSRVVAPEDLRARIAGTFDLPPAYVINLLGMTELASQIYEDTLAAAVAGRPPRPGMIPPPWVRTVVVDPTTLTPVPEGELGLLCHLDLANLERPAALRTQDIGRSLGAGFEILGRAEGAQASGCSLTLEELLSAAPGPSPHP